MARKLRQVTDLYVVGKVVTLQDGSTLWMQALNPFEQDAARNEAQIAKARLSLAIRDFGGDEQAKVRMYFFEDGVEAARDRLVDAQVALATPRIVEKIQNDPEWTERLSIIDRGNVDTARNLEPNELEVIAQITSDFTTELTEKMTDEREYQTTKFEAADDDVLWTEYLNWYIDRRCGEVMLAEFRLHQLFYGTRWCDATDHGENTWTHENCDHDVRVFGTKDEVRSAPEHLQNVLLDAYDALEFSVRDAKNSDRQGSSFDSSPLPSEAEASTASTPAETRVAPPGTSSSPSPTPSPSSALAS